MRIFIGFMLVLAAANGVSRYGWDAPTRPETRWAQAQWRTVGDNFSHPRPMEQRGHARLHAPRLTPGWPGYGRRTGLPLVERAGAAPVGVRHKNYWNVKMPMTGGDWVGAIGYDSRGHAVFDDAAYGVRAAIALLRTYQLRHNRTSIEEIIARWAPVADGNPTKDYVEHVARALGVPADRALNLFNGDGSIREEALLRKLLAAMARYECGTGFQVKAEELNRGVNLYGG